MSSGTTNVEQAWKGVGAAYLDGHLDFLAHKHKQLYALFDGLQGSADQYGVSKLELHEVLASIGRLIDNLPRNIAKEHARSQNLEDLEDEGRATGTGPIVIVRNSAFPLASWAIPLSQAIVDGNSALILITPDPYSIPTYVTSALDVEAYAFVEVAGNQVQRVLDALPGKTGVVAHHIKHLVEGSARLHQVPLGATPLIVDQSIAPGGQPLSPKAEASKVTPRSVIHAAQQAVSILDRDGDASLGQVAYCLVHENVLEPFLRALKPMLRLPVDVQPLVENRSKIESFLSLLGPRLPDKFLPIYTVRSIDAAIDFVQSQQDTARLAYVLAAPSFGAYVVNSIKRVDTIFINDFTASAVALGPFTDGSRFSFTRKRCIHLGPLKDHKSNSSLGALRIKPWKLKQDIGKRIDFFGGSFLFAGGTTALALLSATGYGLFTLGRFAWAMYYR